MRLSLLLTLAFALSLDAQTVRGRITDADGKPVANATVQVGLADRPSLHFAGAKSVKTAEDGRYAIDLPQFAPEARAVVIVSLPAHSVVRSKDFSVADVESQIDVVLPRFQRVPLRVADVDGKPVKDARIMFAPSDEAAELPASSMLAAEFESRMIRTGDDGNAVLHLVPGLWAFAAGASGYRPTMIPEQTIKRDASVAMTLEKGFAIRGRLHRKGAGVAKAYIFRFVAGRDSRIEHAATTDDDGAFEIPELEARTHMLQIVKEDELLSHAIDLKAPSTTEIELPPAGTLRVRFVDAVTQEPVRTFTYTLAAAEPTEEGAILSTPPGGLPADTENGVITFTLPLGRYRVSGRDRTHTASEPIEVPVGDREPTEVTIALERGITISGRVSDENNVPVPGAEVTLDITNLGPRGMRGQGMVTDENGSFSFPGLDAGTRAMAVRKDGFVPYVRALDVNRDTDLDVQLSRGLTLEGIVRSAGQPVADAKIRASTDALGGTEQHAVSDANGRFVLRGLAAGRYTVSASKDFAHTEIEVVVDSTETRQLVLSLDPEPTGVLYGVVSGVPTNMGSKIVLRAVFARRTDFSSEEVQGAIDADGSYRIENVPAGETFVSARIESVTGTRASRRMTVEVVAGQPLRVDLDLGGGITVRGRVTEHGKPVAGAGVRFLTEEGVGGAASSRADGTYEAVLPAAGVYQVFAHASSGEGMVNAELVREIREGDMVNIELRENTIKGTVVDAMTRAPMPEARVAVTHQRTPNSWNTQETTTDIHGRFSVVAGMTGQHRVTVFAPGYAHAERTIQLGGPPLSPLLFELTKTEGLRVRVLDANNTPLGARIAIANADGSELAIRCVSSAGGGSYACSLAPGNYRLRVYVQGYAPLEMDVTAPGSVDVTLE